MASPTGFAPLEELGPASLLATFLVPSVLMGLGIAIDVAIATLARFRDRSMDFTSWTLPVATTHVLFPAIGYYGWWYLGHEFQHLGLVLGIVAFGLISVFIYGAICEWIDVEPRVSLEPLIDWPLEKLAPLSRGRLAMVLAVSMDAFWSGPAKAAQAASGQWSANQVLVSFFIAGGVVALVAEFALLAAFGLRRVSFSDNARLAAYMVCGKYLEATILFAFGILSLWNAFSAWLGLGTLVASIAVSAAVMLVTWAVCWRRLVRVQLAELGEGPANS